MRKIKKGDTVVVLTGKDKGKRGEVINMLAEDRILVNNVNLVKKHTKPNPNTGEKGGILDKEAPIHISNLAIYNSETDKADKVAINILEDGKKVRVFKSNGKQID